MIRRNFLKSVSLCFAFPLTFKPKTLSLKAQLEECLLGKAMKQPHYRRDVDFSKFTTISQERINSSLKDKGVLP